MAPSSNTIADPFGGVIEFRLFGDRLVSLGSPGIGWAFMYKAGTATNVGARAEISVLASENESRGSIGV